MSEFDQIAENILSLLSDNIVPLIIGLSIVGYVLFMKYKQDRDPKTRAIREKWQTIQKTSVKLTDKFFATIADLDHPSLGFQGEIYQIDNKTYSQTYDDYEAEELEEDELRALKESNATLPPDKQVDIHEENGRLYKLTPVKRVEKRKSITALAMLPSKSGGEIVAFRRSDLRETETILSEAEQQPLPYLDPTIANSHLRIAIFAVLVYEIVLLYMLISNTEATMLFSASTWPWYVVLVIAWLMKVRVDQNKIGFKALYRGYLIGHESFKLHHMTGDSTLVLTIPVFEVKLHYHPAIPTKNLLTGLGREELYNEYLKTLERRVTQTSSENASLESRLAQAQEIITHKDQQLVAARNEHLRSYYDGVVVGYARHHVSNPHEEVTQQPRSQGPGALEWFKEGKILIIAGLILGAFYFLGTGLSDAITNMSSNGGSFDLFSPNMLLGIGLILGVILLIGRILPGK